MSNKTLTVAQKAQLHFTQLFDNVYQVLSDTSNTVYEVAMVEGGFSCTCKWGQYNPVMNPASGKCCSHVLAVFES